jgi:RNA polymerase subunit RPABC4/transcription elongation factor Spt4
MSIQQFEEKLNVIAGEIADISKQSYDLLAEIGGKALPELRGKPEYAEYASKIDANDAKVKDLKQQEIALAEEKTQYLKEEKERVAMYTCTNCKRVNPEGAKFCEECGTPVGVLPREFCKACGTLNQTGVKFCGECGSRLPETT